MNVSIFNGPSISSNHTSGDGDGTVAAGTSVVRRISNRVKDALVYLSFWYIHISRESCLCYIYSQVNANILYLSIVRVCM